MRCFAELTQAIYLFAISLVRLLKHPHEYIPAFDAALLERVKIQYDVDKHDIGGKEYNVGFRGSFGDHHVNLRTLRALHIGKMISLEGIVTRCEYDVSF